MISSRGRVKLAVLVGLLLAAAPAWDRLPGHAESRVDQLGEIVRQIGVFGIVKSRDGVVKLGAECHGLSPEIVFVGAGLQTRPLIFDDISCAV